jgi:hypothetical protein
LRNRPNVYSVVGITGVRKLPKGCARTLEPASRRCARKNRGPSLRRCERLWPEIKAALDKGHSLKTVCDCLEVDGIAITVQTLGSYITRIRRRSLSIEAATEPRPQRFEEDAEGRDAPPVESNAKAAKPSDPLANVRDRLGKRTGFDYRPELADPKDLI